MKKLLCLLMLAALVFALTACGCKHENTQVINAVDATCTEDGYTGDTYCNDCKKTTKKGTSIPATGHAEGILVNAVEATCQSEGYSGDLICSACREVLSQGETLPVTDHVPGERYPSEASCEYDGYTGDVYCAYCYTLLEEGTAIPALGHDLGKPEGVIEATCTMEGYTGDSVCVRCGKTVKGETVARLEHSFGEDGICTECGWKQSGYYNEDGSLQFTWQDLLDRGFVTLREDVPNTMTGLNSDKLTGTLVIDESIQFIANGTFENACLSEYWLPCTMSYLSNYCSFRNVQNVKKIVIFAPEVELGSSFFAGCSVEEIDIRGTVTEVSNDCFYSCASLKSIDLSVFSPEITCIPDDFLGRCSSLTEVTLPDTITVIDRGAFCECTSLKSITLPESLTTLTSDVFNGSGLTEVTLPASVNYLGSNAFSNCADLVTCDLSKTSITELRQIFINCTSLKNVYLPATLTSGSAIFDSTCPIERLVLTDGITGFEQNYPMPYLTEIVWPVSMISAKSFTVRSDILPALKTIYYRGSESDWKWVEGTDELPQGIEIVYDYTGE